MATLTACSHQYFKRPDDERFLDLDSMFDACNHSRDTSREVVVSTAKVRCEPTDDNRGLLVYGPNGAGYAPTHWSFGQLATLSEAPADYLRKLGSNGLAPVAADCINAGLKVIRKVDDVRILLRKPDPENACVGAVNGPRYGTVWNVDVIDAIRQRVGNGRDGDFVIPGEFGKAVPITKANTTLFASDRDMFVFLADEKNRIEIPGRRPGLTGSLARGFFIGNSEVGKSRLFLSTFLFDYACSNRMVWGAEQVFELNIRHTASAPDRWAAELLPIIRAFSRSSVAPIEAAIEGARAAKLDNASEFLAKRFGPRMVDALLVTHVNEEARPVETVWDAVTAVTAYARGIEHQDRRIELERAAGALLKLAA
jgi:hypothetical protein